jgi:hypothetical protein
MKNKIIITIEQAGEWLVNVALVAAGIFVFAYALGALTWWM